MGGICGFCDMHIGHLSENISMENMLTEMCASYTSSKTALGSKQEIFKLNLFNKEFLVSLDGQIYNITELRSFLKNKKFEFQTNEPGEVILYLYLEKDIDFPKYINGAFSIFIYDPFKGQVVLVRDQFGIKPLYYTLKDGALIFGSHIKSLLEHPLMKNCAVLDKEGQRALFALGPARYNNSGILKDIYQVPPAHVAVYRSEGLRLSEYQQLESYVHTDSYDETVHQIKSMLIDAIKRQLDLSKNPCCFLSGGLDSTLVTAIAAKLYLAQTGKPMATYSFDFNESEKHFKPSNFQPELDFPWVEKAVKVIGTEHNVLYCDHQQLADNLFKAVDARGLPGMADIDSSLLHFCSQVKHGLALTGECADEIFGGYPWFRESELNCFPWTRDQAMRKIFLHDELLPQLDIDGYLSQAYESALKLTPLTGEESPEEKRHREITFLTVRWFMQTLVDRMGAMSEYCNIDARVPYCDMRLVQYLYNVPWEMKYKNEVVKGLLREAGRGIIPDDLLFRKKSPYPKIYNPAYETLVSERLLDTLSGNAPVLSLVDKKKVMDYIKQPKDYGRPWFGQLMAGPQMLAYLLQINYWLEAYNVRIV